MHQPANTDMLLKQYGAEMLFVHQIVAFWNYVWNVYFKVNGINFP